MLKYEAISEQLQARMLADRQNGTMPSFAADDNNVIRRRSDHDKPTVLRPPFVRDIDKIMHCPYYNRYADKTQVFSFYRNDDITRRMLHVQLVSRIARTIGKALHLDLDLIEAISLGHDIGHTPFGHAGETYLDALYNAHTGRHFSHNIHSVRVLDSVFPYNISLQTLSGIASHNGELELKEYYPRPLTSFEQFDRDIEACYLDRAHIKTLVPSTLEGCVMRISDIIAYLGKDRQDAERARLATPLDFDDVVIGTHNAEIINNLMVNIIENSYSKPYIRMDEAHFEALKKAKDDNYRRIYKCDAVEDVLHATVKPMMEDLYERLLNDLLKGHTDSPIFTHHIEYVKSAFYHRDMPYEENEPNQIVVDYIASMTDDYFIDLHAHLFPHSHRKITYKGYFD